MPDFLAKVGECSLSKWSGEKKHCRWCDKELTGRQEKWCSPDCSNGYGRNHWWTVVRPVALRAAGYRCSKCGFVGWNDVPDNLLKITRNSGDLDPISVTELDWAVALGFLDPADVRAESTGWFHESWEETVARRTRIGDARKALPESIRELVAAEEKLRRKHSPWPRSRHAHQLEVNHIRPLRTSNRPSGCHNHQDGLEVLCRPCHTAVTRLQIVTARAYGPGSCTIACWEGQCSECFQNIMQEDVWCRCPHHSGGDMSAMERPPSNPNQLQLA